MKFLESQNRKKVWLCLLVSMLIGLNIFCNADAEEEPKPVFKDKIFLLEGRYQFWSLNMRNPSGPDLDQFFRLWISDGLRVLEGHWGDVTTRWWISFRGMTSVVSSPYTPKGDLKSTDLANVENDRLYSAWISYGVQPRGMPHENFALAAHLVYTTNFVKRALQEGYFDPWIPATQIEMSCLMPRIAFLKIPPYFPRRIEYFFDESCWKARLKKFGGREKMFQRPPPWPYKDVPKIIAEVTSYQKINDFYFPTRWLTETYGPTNKFFSSQRRRNFFPRLLQKLPSTLELKSRVVIGITNISLASSCPKPFLPSRCSISDFRVATQQEMPGLNIVHFGNLQPGSKGWEKALYANKNIHVETLQKEFGLYAEKQFNRKTYTWWIILGSGFLGLALVMVKRSLNSSK